MYRCVFESAAGVCEYWESHKYRACCNVDASWNMGIRSKLSWNLNLIVPEDSSCSFFSDYSFWKSPKHRNSNCTQSCNLDYSSWLSLMYSVFESAAIDSLSVTEESQAWGRNHKQCWYCICDKRRGLKMFRNHRNSNCPEICKLSFLCRLLWLIIPNVYSSLNFCCGWRIPDTK